MKSGSILRSIIDANFRLSRNFDARLFSAMTVDGNRDYVDMLKRSIGDGLRIADIGGGKSPLFSPQEVDAKRLRVTGVDIDKEELEAAPSGAYAEIICADITEYRGRPEADVVVVQSLLEHVRDGHKAIQGVASFCRDGGTVYTFCPNRRAWFAIINRVLPEALKKRLLFAIYPSARGKQGFPAFYDGCTPAEMSAAMRDARLKVDEIKPYFVSTYFMFCFPLFVLWRLVNWPLMKRWPMAFCETFVIIASKPGADTVAGSATP